MDDSTPPSVLWTLALFFAFSSLAFGCMEPWSIATCECLLFLGAAAAGWSDASMWKAPRRLAGPALLVGGLACVGLLQLVPLPVAFVGRMKPDRVAIYTEGAQAEALLRSDSYRLDPLAPANQEPPPADPPGTFTPPLPKAVPLSFVPGATGRGVVALLAGLCLIFLLERAGASWGTLRAVALAAGVSGVAVALLALAHYGGSRETLLGFRPSAYAVRAFGPFVNRSHGVAFINLALPFAYFLLWRSIRKPTRHSNRLGKGLILAALAATHLALLALSGARSGLLVLALYPTMLLVAFAAKKRAWAVICLALFLCVAACGAWLGFQTGILSDPVRLAWDLEAWSTRSWAGTGINSFEQRFPAILSSLPLRERMRSTHLENEYLQLLFEGGYLPAAGAIVLAFLALALSFRAVAASTLSLWTAPAFVAEVIHMGVDFTAHVFPIVGAFLLHWVWLSAIVGRRGVMEDGP